MTVPIHIDKEFLRPRLVGRENDSRDLIGWLWKGFKALYDNE